MAANLREAFRESELLGRGYERAVVLTDAPVLMVPVDEFREESKETLYRHAFSGAEGDVVLYNVLPALHAVAVFAVNKDFKLVVDDHFEEATFVALCSPVWNYLHQRSFTGNRRKLYGYFHDKKLEIVGYDKNRFKFCNSFAVNNPNDALYFLLGVWKQLGLEAERDELHLVGDIIERDALLEEAQRYVKRVFYINPSGEFNRAPVTQIKGMPYDLITLYLKGR